MPGPHPAPLGEGIATPDASSAFRALHERFFVMPNPWDAGTARLLAAKGFAALATSSAALAWTLGKPDGAVTRGEAIAHAVALGAASGLPVNGDFEAGYGETPAEVADTIAAAIDAGVAGCSVEDLARDRPEPLYERTVACRRIEAARETIVRSGSDFVLTGRCEAFLAGDPDPLAKVLDRLPAYRAAGADVVYAPGLTIEAAVAAVVERVDCPVNVLAGLGGVSDDLAALERLGVRRISLGSGLARVALGAFLDAAEALAAGRVALAGAARSSLLDGAFGPGPRRTGP